MQVAYDYFVDRSPSLRGSGLKYENNATERTRTRVSLFTREWIEMTEAVEKAHWFIVSLFTREWIEIATGCLPMPGLQGLPLYEGVD